MSPSRPPHLSRPQHPPRLQQSSCRSVLRVQTLSTVLLLFTLASSRLVHAAEVDSSVLLTVHDHRFSPAELHVPAQQHLKLTVQNKDSTPEEFESHALNKEKRIPPGASVVIHLAPLAPGRYEFFGDYHADTAQGVLVVE